ncbi:MAG: TerB family tellurite resistance protein [Gammaproteobacteria bacterium]|nr:TerB family tellurite resistance protein [Gammaproteobacteria bacterium]
MIDNIKRFFEQQLLPDDDADEATREAGIQHATAALLIELAKADFDQDEMERALIVAMLRDTFDLGQDMLDELMSLADESTKDAHDVFQFTQLINEHYDYADKERLIENLWSVAYADGRLDRYEEQFIRRIAGLIHVANSDFIKAKVTVLERLESE